MIKIVSTHFFCVAALQITLSDVCIQWEVSHAPSNIIKHHLTLAQQTVGIYTLAEHTEKTRN